MCDKLEQVGTDEHRKEVIPALPFGAKIGGVAQCLELFYAWRIKEDAPPAAKPRGLNKNRAGDVWRRNQLKRPGMGNFAKDVLSETCADCKQKNDLFLRL